MVKASKDNSKGGGWWLAVAGLALVGLIALPILRRGPAADPGVVDGQRAPTADAASVEAEVPGLPFQRMRGRWLRSDGDYLLDLRWVGSDGRVEAAYLNPRPVHVSRAEAMSDAGRIKLLVELQDTGYPGCLYTLHYDAEADRLIGSYYQAARRETFAVEFNRQQDGGRPSEP